MASPHRLSQKIDDRYLTTSSAVSITLEHQPFPMMDGELNAWRRKHGISDDAFASLRNIIITSGSNTDSALTDVDQAALLAIEEWNNRLSSFSQVSQYEHMLPGDDGHTILGEPFEPGTAASFYQYEDPKTSHPVDNGAFRVPFFKIAGPTPYSISNDAYSEYQERDVVPELPSNWPSQDQLQSAYSHPTTNFVPNEAQYGLEPQATTHSAVSNAQAEVFRWEHPSANSIYIEPTDQKSRFVKIAPKPGSPVPEAPVKRSNRVQKTTTRSRNGLRPCIRCWLRKREVCTLPALTPAMLKLCSSVLVRPRTAAIRASQDLCQSICACGFALRM